MFSPKSIALIGASHEKGKVGNILLENLTSLGYKGKVYPVNPKRKEVLGKKCFASIREISEKIDLAIIAVSAPIVPAILKECGEHKICSVVIISAGFKEIGQAGEMLEKQIIEIARKYKIALLGPNCLGFINTEISLNASFAEGMPDQGNIGIISQSGALAVAMLDWAKLNYFGVSKMISLGNKAVFDEIDALEFLANDSQTKVIAIYLEGISRGTKFIETAAAMTTKKPILVLKSGITEKAQKAVAFHTGAMAASDDTINAAFEKAGILRVDTLKELFELSRAFSFQSPPAKNRVAIITNAGGPGILAIDALKNTHLVCTELDKKTKETLKKHLPLAASVNNPIDIIGDALVDRYEMALDTTMRDKNVDMALIILTPQAMTEVEKTAKIVAKISQKNPQKPILCAFLGGKKVAEAIEILNKNKIPNFDSPEKAIEIFGKMWQYRRETQNVKRETFGREFEAEFEKNLRKKIEQILCSIKKRGENVVIGEEAENIFRLAGFPMVESGLAKNLDEAKKIAQQIGYPVVLKIISPKIVKKTDFKAVRVNIKNENELTQNFQEMMAQTSQKVGAQNIHGILIQKMLFNGREMILGMRRDANFGPLLMFGLGGIYAEVFKDVSFGLAPLTPDEARKTILNIKSQKILEGTRGQAPADIAKTAEILTRLAQLALAFSQISQIDINPLMVFDRGQGAKIVDVRILLN